MALICPLTHFYNINPKTKQLHRKERLIQPCVFSGGGTLCVLRQIVYYTEKSFKKDCIKNMGDITMKCLILAKDASSRRQEETLSPTATPGNSIRYKITYLVLDFLIMPLLKIEIFIRASYLGNLISNGYLVKL